MELEGQVETIRKHGRNVAALSYDSVEILKDFTTRKKISFPLLSDPDLRAITAFRLQNDVDYKPGQLEHGVPYPATFVTDAAGVIRSKFFEKTYVERRTAASALALSGDTPTAVAGETSTPAFKLRTSLSNALAAPGQRITLVLDFEMKPGMHAYAPGDHGYRPLRARFEPHPLVTYHETVLPPSKPYHFAPLNETVPVFEGRFRLTQDVTLAAGRQFAELLQSPEPRLELQGALEYQVCSDKVCYPPATIPLRFSIGVTPLDRERSPEALRHKPPKP